MLGSLIEEAISKKGEILDQISEYDYKDLNLDKYWKDKTIPLSEDSPVIGAGDGSFNKKRFISFYLYAVAAESLIHNPNTDEGLTNIESSNVGGIPHQSRLDDRLSNFMNIMELKNSIKCLKNRDLDYYLFDGSIYGDLVWLFPRSELSANDKRELLAKYLAPMKELLFDENIPIASKFLLDKESVHFKNYDDYRFLESVEKTLLLTELLKENKRIVAISKTSSATDLLNWNIPDIALFNFYSKKEGYSRIYRPEPFKRDFNIDNGFLKSIDFTVFYARLAPFKSVLKFELPYKASEEDCVKVLSDLKKDSIDGYPYLLHKAHHDVVISNKDMDALSNIVDVVERQGREML